MSDIFVSYDSDDRDAAEQLAHALESYGWSVWWDRRIPPGQDYAKVIETALKEAKCVVVLWSKESAASRWVQNEAADGAEREVLVPALIEDTAIPFEFRRIQAANLIGWDPSQDNESFDFFVQSITTIMQAPPPNPEPPKPKPKPVPQPDPAPRPAPKKESVGWFGWKGRNPGYAIASGVCAVIGLASMDEGSTWGDEDMLLGGIVFVGVAVFLWWKSGQK